MIQKILQNRAYFNIFNATDKNNPVKDAPC